MGEYMGKEEKKSRVLPGKEEKRSSPVEGKEEKRSRLAEGRAEKRSGIVQGREEEKSGIVQGKGQKISEEVHGKENKKSDKHQGKEELVKKEAIENKFDSNVGYLAAFETFLMGKDEKTPPRDKVAHLAKPCDVSLVKLKQTPKNHHLEQKLSDKKTENGSTFKILNSTMHPKKVLKTLKDKDLDSGCLRKKEEERKPNETDDKIMERKKEEGCMKRKEREWEEKKQLEREKEEAKLREK